MTSLRLSQQISKADMAFIAQRLTIVIVNKAWIESKGHATYVGLWHTHPEPTPNYSFADKCDWERALRESRYEGQHLIFVIVGQLSLRCWAGEHLKKTTKISLIGEYHFGN
ncbi:Mov34/MPN/PAD-1 family protein [Vibrio parahaemolyticus]